MDPPRRAAIVGAGPSGFYAADQLLGAGFEVDLYEALPTPYGLVRAGVAPDHPKIKSVTRVYDRIAARPGFRFFGGVELGVDIGREDLLARYHAVLYAVGTAVDRRMGIPGEDRPGSVAATQFVAWYNGHPAHADHEFNLRGSRAVVIGNGNVAIDVARMLVLEPAELAPTDTADHALAAFAGAGVEHVTVLGRRGPAQAAFTTPELRELGELGRADVIVDPAELALDRRSAAWLASDDVPATVRRNLDILRDYAERGATGKSHAIELRFLRSPVEVCGDGLDGTVTGVRLACNRLEPDGRGGLRAVPTGDEEVLRCDLVVRSIGYRGSPLEGLPCDRSGLIRNDRGRVCDQRGVALTGEYVVGWIKRGPSGVIGTNKKDAADTVRGLLDDAEAGALNEPGLDVDGSAVERWLRGTVSPLVTWAGWETIDARERALGAAQGRPRVKFVRLAELQRVAGER